MCTLQRFILFVGVLAPFTGSNLLGFTSPQIRSGIAAEQTLGEHRFTLPRGFEIAKVAGPPLVDRPICVDFDDQGRLYVADSSGSNEDVTIQLEKRPHRIVRLEDTTGDGVFDKSVLFADRMAFPEGTMWHDGSLYVTAPPHIWKLTDTNDDGTADEREIWFDAKTLTHCANDLHGPFLGPDGWIYWCKGAFAEQTYEQPGQKPFVTRASHIFRRRVEGGPVEAVMTGGMDNPVEVAFMPGGERIFTTTFLQHPSGGRRDGLIHAVYGGVYGKVHNVLDGHLRTGPVMPVLAHLGAAAPCGLTRLQSDQLGANYQNNLLATLFNMHKVTRHRLSPQGGTFANVTEDFVVSDNLDFHPTDVIEDADGSVLVIDTGGWYKICCPTSQLSKPDVLGAIYRVRRSDSHVIADDRGKRIDWQQASNERLTKLLGDDRFAVRERAKQTLAKRGVNAIDPLASALASSDNGQQRLAAVWTLALIDTPEARKASRRALADSSPVVRRAALHTVSLLKDQQAVETLEKLLDSSLSSDRRAAAEALGRLQQPRSIAPLLAAADQENDRACEHSLIYALLQIGDASRVRSALAGATPATRKVALIALDQMEAGNLQAANVLPQLESNDADLRAAAWWITEHHSDWAPLLADHFRRSLKGEGESLARLATFGRDGAIQAVMGEALADAAVSVENRKSVIATMGQLRLGRMPAAWTKPLAELIETKQADLLPTAVDALRSFPAKSLAAQFHQPLRAIGADKSLPDQIRLSALLSLERKERELDREMLDFLVSQLSSDRAVAARSLAIDLLADSGLTADQLLVVIGAIPDVGPMELQRLLELFSTFRSRTVGLRLVTTLQQSPAALSLPVELLTTQLAKIDPATPKAAESLMRQIEQANREKIEKLESILKLTRAGDIRRGQRVFHSTKTSCIACHPMGYLGGKVGPDLTRIGRIRSERDLLESILFPSVSIVRSFEPTTIATVDGRIFNGVVMAESASEMSLQLDAQKIVHIPLADIEEQKPGTISVMPTGLDKLLSPQELADLVTFLKAAQ